MRRAFGWLRADSWRFRLWAAAFGTGIATGAILWLEGSWPDEMAPDDLFVLAITALGGAFGGYLMSGWFGRPGPPGAALTLLGAWLAGGLGGAFTGSVILPGFGTIMGALVGVSVPFQGAFGLMVWLLCCGALHYAIRVLRGPRFQAPA